MQEVKLIMDTTRPKLLMVGAFPSEGVKIYGGVATTCRMLLQSNFPSFFNLSFIDSTQKSNPPPKFIIRFFYSILRVFNYVYSIMVKRPDAILLFASVGASMLEKCLMAWMARFLGIPVFLFPRGAKIIDDINSSFLNKIIYIPAMRGANFLLCQGLSWQKFAVNVLGFSIANAPIIPNWTATPELLSVGESRGLMDELHGRCINIVFLGWLEEEKGIFDLLMACKKLSPDFNFKLLVAGRGSAEPAVLDFLKINGLYPNVELIGWVEDAEKMSLLSNADILVLPSWAEGFPNVVVEAMACKVAVIVTDVGLVSDNLVNDVHAIIIPPKNSDAIFESLSSLIVDSKLRDRLSLSGFDHAKNMFSVEQGVVKLANFICNSITRSV
jgi:glycosyltransferase involved in cell wall biosynthesis